MSLVERPYVLSKVRNLKATQKNHLYLNITSYYYFIQFITTTRLRSSESRFQRVKTDFRLNRKDAMFVDVIRTCAYTSTYKYSLGMSRALGHADFYPNGGGGQPECYSGQFFVQLQSPLANLRTAKTVIVSAAKKRN